MFPIWSSYIFVNILFSNVPNLSISFRNTSLAHMKLFQLDISNTNILSSYSIKVNLKEVLNLFKKTCLISTLFLLDILSDLLFLSCLISWLNNKREWVCQMVSDYTSTVEKFDINIYLLHMIYHFCSRAHCKFSCPPESV